MDLATLEAELQRVGDYNGPLNPVYARHLLLKAADALERQRQGLREGAALQRQQDRSQGARVSWRLRRLVDGYRTLLNDAEWEIDKLASSHDCDDPACEWHGESSHNLLTVEQAEAQGL